MKRLVSLILTFAMLLSLVPSLVVQAENYSTIKIGDYVQMGTYNGEPILWRCVAFEKVKGYDENGNPIMDATDTTNEYKEGYLPLMLSDKIICFKAFDANTEDEYASDHWYKSTIRSWLNSEQSAGNVEWIGNNPPTDDMVDSLFDRKFGYDQEAGFLHNFSTNELSAIQKVTQKAILPKTAYENISDYGSDYHRYATNLEEAVSNYETAYAEQVTDTVFLMDVQQLYTTYKHNDILGYKYFVGKPTLAALVNDFGEDWESAVGPSASEEYEYILRTPYREYSGKYSFWATGIRTVESYGGSMYDGWNYEGVCSYTLKDYYSGIRPAFFLKNNVIPISGVGNSEEPYVVEIMPTPIPDNAPTLSVDSTNLTLTIGEQEWITGWVDGIYNKISEAELTVTSSNENTLPIISQDSMCMSPITDGDECFSSISAFVKGAAPGTSTLTFYCQGEKLGTIDVTVEAVIAETISDETILKAEILNRNSQFDSHRNTIQSPAVVLNNALMNNSSQSWATAYMFTYELSKILSLSIPDLEKFDMKSYYEAVLMDILENDNESVWSDFYSTWGSIYGGYNEDIVQKIIDEIPEFEKYKDTKLSKETDIEIVLDTIKDTKGEFKDIKIDFSLFDTFGFCYDTLTDNLAVIDEIYAYSAITQEKIDVLKAIQEKTSNAELAKACESMIKRYQEVHSEVVAEVATSAARESLIATGKNILELSQSVTVDLFLQVAQTTSAAELVKSYSTGKMIMTGSRLATDLVINSTDISKNIFVIAAYSDIENEIKKVILSSETAFEGNKTYDNAVKYIASADVFKAALLNSCDLYIKFVKDVESGTKGLEIAKGLILGEPKDILKNLWQVNAEYNEKIKQAEHIKSMIQTTDFYDTYGTDIVEYISHIVSTTPSAWAQEYVDWAIANNLLPYDYLRGNYQNNITRAEFCTLLTFMIQEFTGKSIEELQGNLPYDPKLFSDSYYDYVYYMASLGIVNGVSETEFNPLGEITREEAAVMLYRAAKVAGCDVSAPATNLNGVSNWATDGVNFVVDRGIMTGTDVGFEPKGTYTKEQAITTFVRFMQNLK